MSEKNSSNNPLVVTLKLGSIFSASGAILLLVLRALFPQLGASLPGIYELLDEVILPIINWPFGVLQNIVEWFANLPLIKDLISWIGSLAA